MRDKRPVDELTIEELERILAIRKREARQTQLKRMKADGRVIAQPEPAQPRRAAPVAPPPLDPIEQALKDDLFPEPPAAPPPRPVNGSRPQVRTLPYFEDEGGLEAERDAKRRGDDAWQRFVNGALLLVEIAAVAGLIFLGVQLVGSINTLEDETRQAQAMSNATRQATLPTIAPTPTLRLDQVVLPGGHTIDPVTNTVDFNYDEIPAHLLPLVRSQIRQPVIERPEITDEDALRVIIPRLNLDEAIVPGTDFEALKMGVGRELNGATPSGNTGNVVLAAHNDVYGELFRHLDELEPGDRFQIQTQTRTFTYVITHWELVEPTAVHVMEDQGRPTATLISCYPYRVNNKRIVVFAERIDV